MWEGRCVEGRESVDLGTSGLGAETSANSLGCDPFTDAYIDQS